MGVIITITATSVQPEQQPVTRVLHGQDSGKVLFDALNVFTELLNREDIIRITTKKEVNLH